MSQHYNVIKAGATRQGKTLSAAVDAVNSPNEAVVAFDPHKQSFCQALVTHVAGNVLYEQLSNVRMALGYELLTPSTDPDPLVREQQNQQRAELFCAILLRRRDMEGLA